MSGTDDDAVELPIDGERDVLARNAARLSGSEGPSPFGEG